ncbi:craniofacial development protein 2-like [Condylostylus longicornis]|uniref:craniofacial development protein 2-like n=1 Tax=Condylostylus longicornis TaxID=2530218 RepID=UPI00244E4100|nr:craniofacial development protein 2-like [Condylostylus longicornis]
MSWNSKSDEILIELTRHKIDICAISETKKKGKGSGSYGDYILLYSGKDKNDRAKSGVGILIHKKFENSISDVKYVNDRLLMVTLNYGKSILHLISTYARDINKPAQEIDDFYCKMQNLADSIRADEKLILLGDFNARIGDNVISGIKQRFNENVINENGEKLIEFFSQNLLRINNTFFNHKLQHKYTWSNTRGQQSMIDFIITNRECIPTQILDVRTLTSPNIGSDHGLVLMKFSEKISWQKSKPPEYKEKFNIESLINDSTKTLYENRLNNKIAANSIAEFDNSEQAWKKLSANIINAAKEALGTRKVNIHAKNNKTPWFTIEVKTICAEKRKAYLKYRSERSRETYRAYIAIRNRTNQREKKIKEEY